MPETMATSAETDSQVAVPDVNVFVAAFAPTGVRPRSLCQLHSALCQIDPLAGLFFREDMIIQLAKWVRHGGEVPSVQGSAYTERGQIRRLRVLVQALTTFPPIRARLCWLVQTLLAELSAQSFFACIGIPGDRGLVTDTIDRLSRRLMPQPIDEQDMTQLVARMFPRRSDVTWINDLPADLVERFIELIRSPVDPKGPTASEGHRPVFVSRGDQPLGAMPSLPDLPMSEPSVSGSVFAPLRIAELDAILLLASRVSSAGLSDVIRARSLQLNLQESPFFRLPRSLDMLLATRRRDADEIALWGGECKSLVQQCRQASRAVLARLEATGVSVDVVYRLELIERSLRRIERLVDTMLPVVRTEHARRVVGLLAALLEDRRRDLSLRDIVGTNTRLLARKVIERAGLTGEHYITTTPREYVKMFFSAAGGGVLTAGTAAIKYFIGHLHRPLLQEGILAGANYAGSFMAMQMLGFTLATKQPSMTAAALAGALKKGTADHQAVVTILARLVRSQIAAAAGNVLLVIPASFLVDLVWVKIHGDHMVATDYAEKTIHSLHPTESGTIAFAALTGVILWLSSLAAGYVENWAVYRRLPEAIAEHRVHRYVGKSVTSWLSRVFARNIAGIGGNVSVGFMLGFAPIIGQFIGFPMEVRHVTLSTASLTLAVSSLGSTALLTSDLHAACLGILLILLLNLFVSFGFALGLALRAREIPIGNEIRLAGAILLGFVRSPLRFVLPVEKDTNATAKL